MALSILIGEIAGVLRIFFLRREVNRELLLGLIAIGYAGGRFHRGVYGEPTAKTVAKSAKTKASIIIEVEE